MPKILISRHVGDHAMSILSSSGFDLIVNSEDAAPSREWVLKHLADPEMAAMCLMHGQPSDIVDEELLNACGPNVKCLSTFSVGFDHINVKAANERGIKIGHTPGVLDDAVADVTVMLVLMTMRRVENGISLVKAGEWAQIPWAPFVNCGPSISHPSLTISFIGFGRISQATLSRLLAFTSTSHPPRILYTSSRARPDQVSIDQAFSEKFGVEIKRVEREQVAKQGDIVIVLASQNPQTVDFVNKEFLTWMKKTAILVNCARGPLVNSEDLAWALENDEIYGAGLDVVTGEPNVSADHPLVKSRKCVVLPHIGSGDYDTRNKMAELCVRNAINGAKGEALLAEVKV
ncbi:hypothetical protein BCR39DRAFT_479057 [Naematelia encephala]|uniref:Glyoxylate reductase n=1 Tax=Naematelia encephala TaxID=71784 RepID=A0A1Y2BBY6_9TREE|nr:hypothetical protein BCR39DRAFT_479057 [Naematelia encephala]